MSIRELTIHPGLIEKLTALEQEKDAENAVSLFNDAEGYALDALLNEAPVFSDGNRGNWHREWRALRAKHRPSPTIPKPQVTVYQGPPSRGWDNDERSRRGRR